MDIIKFQERLIAFNFDKDEVNATDMLKLYPNKRMGDYLRLKSTKELIKALESETGIPVTTIKQGGRDQGTWMHRLLAYDFAAWLNVEFRVFIYKTFDQAFQIKIAQLNDKLDDQQRQLDYFWDKSDQADLYPKY